MTDAELKDQVLHVTIGPLALYLLRNMCCCVPWCLMWRFPKVGLIHHLGVFVAKMIHPLPQLTLQTRPEAQHSTLQNRFSSLFNACVSSCSSPQSQQPPFLLRTSTHQPSVLFRPTSRHTLIAGMAMPLVASIHLLAVTKPNSPITTPPPTFNGSKTSPSPDSKSARQKVRFEAHLIDT